MLLKAHIFKRRSRGEREEVDIRLFNHDGSDYEGATDGGGGASSAFFGQAYNQDFLSDNSGIGHELSLLGFQVDDPFEVNGNHLVVPQGNYLVHLRTHWTNIGSPSSGHLNIRCEFVYGESNNVNEAVYIDQMAADGIKLDVELIRPVLTPDAGYFRVSVDQNIQPDPEASPNVQSWLTIVKL